MVSTDLYYCNSDRELFIINIIMLDQSLKVSADKRIQLESPPKEPIVRQKLRCEDKLRFIL